MIRKQDAFFQNLIETQQDITRGSVESVRLQDELVNVEANRILRNMRLVWKLRHVAWFGKAIARWCVRRFKAFYAARVYPQFAKAIHWAKRQAPLPADEPASRPFEKDLPDDPV
jgi:hypothetical protein